LQKQTTTNIYKQKRTRELRACWRLTETSARPADTWIATAASHFIGVIFCCAACLEISSALEESPILHRESQAQRAGTTTTLLVDRARTQTCSSVHSICQRRHASPSPALMLLLQSRACILSAELAAHTLKNPTKIPLPCKLRYIPFECIP